MRVLLSTIGSRGDVQPLVALALELRARKCDVRLSVPPDFRDWIEALGLAVVPIGPEVRPTAKASALATISPDDRRRMIEGTVAEQFQTIARAARDRDIIVGATTLQISAPSIAEYLGIPYVFAAYCPAVLPSPHHAPPVLRALGDQPAPALSDYSELWAEDARRWNDTWHPLLNVQRAALGLEPVNDVRAHVITNRPWLAADPTLAPWPASPNMSVFQSGAWMLEDERPLAPELEAFLDSGDPPIYVGFGSVRAPENLGRILIESARALGKRVVLLRGWAELSPVDDKSDCIVIDEVNQQRLFKRVAAVAHHGGAGTTTTAARAGVPQLVMPQHYDQHYFARRVEELGVGVAHGSRDVDATLLSAELERLLHPTMADAARSLASRMRADGAAIASSRLRRRSGIWCRQRSGTRLQQGFEI
jgi:vancomycin aglycone glucosyltransferase